MEQLEQLKNEIKKQIEEHKEAIEDFARNEMYLLASNNQLIVMTYREVLGIIAKIEGDETFF